MAFCCHIFCESNLVVADAKGVFPMLFMEMHTKFQGRFCELKLHQLPVKRNVNVTAISSICAVNVERTAVITARVPSTTGNVFTGVLSVCSLHGGGGGLPQPMDPGPFRGRGYPSQDRMGIFPGQDGVPLGQAYPPGQDSPPTG